MAMMGMDPNQIPAAFRQTQLIHPLDVLALADLCQGEMDQPALDKLRFCCAGP